MSEQLLRSLTNVVLELPFSRRAETEADLIGLKLMALAGFNAVKGPEAFKLLASKCRMIPFTWGAGVRSMCAQLALLSRGGWCGVVRDLVRLIVKSLSLADDGGRVQCSDVYGAGK
jgi:hypothetical protein